MAMNIWLIVSPQTGKSNTAATTARPVAAVEVISVLRYTQSLQHKTAVTAGGRLGLM